MYQQWRKKMKFRSRLKNYHQSQYNIILYSAAIERQSWNLSQITLTYGNKRNRENLIKERIKNRNIKFHVKSAFKIECYFQKGCSKRDFLMIYKNFNLIKGSIVIKKMWYSYDNDDVCLTGREIFCRYFLLVFQEILKK
jgi:hypothetical protein